MIEHRLAHKAGDVCTFADPEKIRQAKQEWESAVDSMPQLICVLDSHGRIIRVNRSTEYWGLGGVAEVRGRSLHSLLHPACVQASCSLRDFWPLACAELDQGRRALYAADDVTLERHIEIMVRPSRFVGDEVRSDTNVYAFAVIDDITDLKQSEARLLRQADELGERVHASTVELQYTYQQLMREIEERNHVERAQARLLTILERTPDFVSLTDANFVPLYVNPAGRKMIGLRYDEDVSQSSIAAFHPPRVAEMLREEVVGAVMRDGVWVGESALLSRSGKEIPTSQVVIVHRSPDGRVEGFSTILRDMTQRKLAEDALRESEEKYRLLVETINEGLIVLDENGVIRFVNARVIQLSGYAIDELIGRMAIDFIEPGGRHDWFRQRKAAVQGDETTHDVIMIGRNGTAYNLRVSPKPVFAADGSFRGVVAVLMDVTEQVRADAALRASEAELRELSAQLLTIQEVERKRIAADLHDGLGQSLSVLKFCVEDALRLIAEKSIGDAEDVLQLLVGKIREAVGEVRRITMDLRPSTLDDLGILATLSWFSREFQRIYHGIRVEQRIGLLEKDVPEPLKTTLYRILQEAMNNIAKHAKATYIVIELVKMDDRVELLIRDNGSGFDPLVVSARKGTERGYGLMSMRDRAKLSAGSCAIESAPGRGTTIHVWWPATPSSRP